MPKLKTHKGTAKRIKLTSTGKLTRRRAFGNHMLSKKSKSRKRTINTSATVSGSMAKNIKRVLGV
ncbi:50S ribosomal protein L35 [Candidatus Saccharimonas aalborgensis]|jgi:large subunit ribosomal protein L35|uniref:Large ribosomal subunit protein bL35 n=1 Tax=Candidatus Saccharimonas aalborgensis TaxID=1332188 RepID=R4PYS2_9BACT|nr:50S ribosomal protein L35 [Candidatus Saccharimonas aalborgensis]AGL62386.1 50S ribosomal protein L35 [Candidatus Saccharimonas aalborgensis]QQR51138.1 MAG: 50S ribosomal protein L35 [Candidatus Saccharibacteria bacterium]QQS68885.1 MAG: 50S ribosomal protein L35 [Candidatus Saccharibacteria bacterium]QQS70232.1 MAG: 50S ribosomal protein L35 [Candidatus Saccharibacteria bacterium]